MMEESPALHRNWHYHFLGIAGVGMSALAEVLHGKGFRVSGSDSRQDEALSRLAGLGIPVSVGHDPALLEGVDAVVFSSALGEHHPIWETVERLGLPRYHRAHLLGALTRESQTLAVTGTHGKTTSSAALAWVLVQAGWDPTALIGGHLPQFGGGNARLGSSPWLVAEADESDGSFLRLSPRAILLTNIENDHLDHHGDVDSLRGAFRAFLARLPGEGLLVYCVDDPPAADLSQGPWNAISYGVGAQADLRVAVKSVEPGGMRLLLTDGEGAREVSTSLSGAHNALNLAGVYALARAIGVPEEGVLEGLATFQGVARRQQFLGQVRGCRIYDDYAHHPTEIRATLTSFLERFGEPVTVIFQPHLYSRTAFLAEAFAEALRPATRIFVTDIYGSREAPREGVSSRLILERLKGHPAAFALPDWRDALPLLVGGDIPPGVLLTMGAGDITGLGPLLLQQGGEP